MTIKRITISVPAELAERIKAAAGETPVSTWVAEALDDKLSDDDLERQWLAFYRSLPPDPEAERWADEMFFQATGTDPGAERTAA